MVQQPVGKSAVGLGLETTPGTPVPASMWIPATTMTPTDGLPLLLDQSMRGSAASAYGAQPGIFNASYALAGDLLLDTFGFPLVGMLGGDVVTGSAAPYSHAVELNNGGSFQPPAFTLVDVDGLQASSYSGVQFSALDMTFDPQALAKWTATVIGSQVTRSATLPAVSYTATPPLAGWRTSLKVDGVAAAYFPMCDLSLKRTVTPTVTLQNVQAARNMFAAGDFSADWKLNAVFETTALRDKYVAGTPVALEVAVANGLSGAAGMSLTLHSSQVYLSSAVLNRGGNYITLDIDSMAIAQASDAGASGGLSPIRATLVNPIGGGIFHA